MSQYTPLIFLNSKMENPVRRWPDNFPLAGAVYIEYLAKNGHFINEEDRLEALRRNTKNRSGFKLSTHDSRIDWLDEKFPRQDMSRYAMDTISVEGVMTTQALHRHFTGRYPQDQISVEAAKEIVNTYNNFWLNYQSPANPDGSSLIKHHECVAYHVEKFGTYGHDTRSTGCNRGATETDDWEMVDGLGGGTWTEVTKETGEAV